MAERSVARAAAVMLLLLLVPFATQTASAESEDGLRIDVHLSGLDRPWLTEGAELLLDVALTNDGDVAQDLTIDPSCGLVLSVVDATGTRIVEGASSCRGQERGLHLEPGTSGLADRLTFNASALDLSDGTYTLVVQEPLSGSSADLDVHVRRTMAWPEALHLDLLPVQRSQEADDGEVLLLRWRNDGPTTVDWPEGDCNVHAVEDAWRPVADCDGLQEAMAPWEVRFAGILPISSFLLDDNGDVLLSTPNAEVVASYTPTHVDASPQDFEVSVTFPATMPLIVARGTVVEPILSLSHAGDEDLPFDTSTTCRADWWAVDASGRIVHDSRWMAPCVASERSTTLAPGSTTVLQGLGWGLVDGDGCTVPSGTYGVVGRVDALDATATSVLRVEHQNTDGCSPMDSLSIVPSIVQGSDELPDLRLELRGPEVGTELVLQGTCAGVLRILDEASNPLIERVVGCGGRYARHHLLPDADAVLQLGLGGIDLITANGEVIQDGTYLVEVELNAGAPLLHRSLVTIALSSAPEADDDVSEAPIIAAPVFTEEGVWSGLQTAEGGCWLLQVQSDRFMALTTGPDGWKPSQGLRGIYRVQPTEAVGSCANVDAEHMVVVEVLEERLSPASSDEASSPASTTRGTVVDNPPTSVVEVEVLPVVVVAVASTTMMGLLVTLFLTNESWRLPASTAGLWMLGIMGRTKETNDGKFQRGRIMGYLEANPGCHFRAVMSALNLSNGQAAHHLRVLEQEEQIWRKKDGRLVRLYPLNGRLHPGTKDDDLPIPPLSPDPSSLQGQILSLLDDDGLMGQFPTQSDLARRLERSQQIISHHLRTLERYGLIEKRQMGVRQRYVLTREAVFLLERGEGQRR
jgi:DNA-binding MarR family transcriptional regulator